MHSHKFYLEKAFVVAKKSLEKGNLPFGCILTGPGGEVLIEGENTVVTDQDAIGHCEINLIHELRGKFHAEFLQQCTIYATTEPCPMCAAAIFWSGIGSLVYALSKEGYHAVAGTSNPAHLMHMKAEELLQRGGRTVTVLGPVMEAEGKLIYEKWYNGI